MQSTATVTSMRNLPPRLRRAPEPAAITRRRLVVLALDDFLAAVIAGGTHVMAQVHFTRGRLHRERRAGKGVVRAVHAALRWGFSVLRDCHDSLLLSQFRFRRSAASFANADRPASGAGSPPPAGHCSSACRGEYGSPNMISSSTRLPTSSAGLGSIHSPSSSSRPAAAASAA